ncbi:hypothetical protein KJ781_01855 [Patescibacteria group bacterium]|nr:hypothetical protein [Patescibacteria group bacterium]MBU1448284.1 hypothetical protein [Patescibacteria group bacterium]MBU2613656.1 hypothetical protein [Patescibacteria group bacterium]
MRRATTVILCILLGALASGVGIGVFLKLANDDRARLVKQLEEAVQASNESRLENQAAIDEANHKLKEASTEVGKAQALVKALEEERDLLAIAEPLLPPSPSTLRSWSDVIAMDLGVSLKQPKGSDVQTNDKNALTLTMASTQTATDGRWFSLTTYDERLEQELLLSLATSTPVAFTVNGRILTGKQGNLPNSPDQILILRIRKDGVITHLLWIRNPGTNRRDASGATDVLGTLRFAS